MTLPKLMGEGDMVSCGDDVITPVALIATDAGDPAALLVIERLPLIATADVGTQIATKELLWPPVKFSGSVRPVVVKPAPVAVTAEMVSVPAPVFCKVTSFAPLLCTVTLPKATGEGVTVNCGGVLAATPVPFRAMEVGEAGSSLTIEMLPETAPRTVGVNFAVKVLV